MPEIESLPDYASLIISFRRPDLVTEVLGSLARQTHPPRRVIVVDNSGDLAADVVERDDFRDGVTLVRRPDNPGYAAAVNEARRVLGSHEPAYLQILTHDARFGDDLGERLVTTLEMHTSAGATAPVLKWVSQPDSVFSAGGRLTRNGRAWNTVRISHPQSPYAVDWVDGAIVLYRISALEQIGWLDERYFLYFEDVDTSWRLARAGWSVLITPESVAYQEPGAHPMYLGIRNMTLFGTLHGFPAWRTAFAVARRVAEESASRLLRRRRPEVGRAFAGWRDGRRLLSGHPRAGA